MSYMWIILLAICLAIPTEIAAGKRDKNRDKETKTKTDCTGCDVNADCNKRGQCMCNPGYSGDGYHCSKGCLCKAEGDPHIKQFDVTDKRDMIHFQGACMYISAQRNEVERPECNFVVKNKHENPPDDLEVAITKYVVIELPVATIQLGPYDNTQDKQVKIDGLRSEAVKTFDDGSRLEYKSGLYYVMTSCGVIVSFDMKHRMSVFVPEDIGNHVSGMCGNCDGFSNNDCIHKSANGEITSYVDADGNCNTAEFGMSWATFDPEQPDCDGYVEEVPTVCAEQAEAAAQFCKKLNFADPANEFKLAIQANASLTDADMTSMQENIADPVFEMCTYDVCATLEMERDPLDDVCKFMGDFAHDVASDIDLPVPCWRTDTFCKQECGVNEVFYQSLTTADEQSCAGEESTIGGAAQDDCGCACAPGYFRSGQICVPGNECGCFDDDGAYYKFGDTFVTEDCTEVKICDDDNGDSSSTIRVKQTLPACVQDSVCKVKDGQYACVCRDGTVEDEFGNCVDGCDGVVCNEKATCLIDERLGTERCVCNGDMEGDGESHCGDMCRCEVWGDPHFEAFDGSTKFDYQGPCTYRLTEVSVPGCEMSVHIKNFPSDKKDVSVVKILYVQIKDGDYIKMGQRNSLFVNGVPKSPPYEVDPLYSVYIDGKNLVLETACGVKVAWNGKNRGSVEMKPELGQTAKGMCGRCDGNEYAWETYDGTDVSSAEDAAVQIGNSNIVPSEPGFDENCEEYQPPPPRVCSDEVQMQAADICSRLTDQEDVFGTCLKKDVKHMEFAQQTYEGCIFDYCQYIDEPNRRQQSVCTAFGDVHDRCIQHANVQEWRTDTFCPAAEDLGCDPDLNMRYNPAMSTCQPTCMEPKGPKRCRPAVTSGCECSDSSLFFENGKCIPKHECGLTVKVKTESGKKIKEYLPIGTTVVTKDCKYRMTVEKVRNKARYVKKKLPKCNKKTETCSKKDGEYGCQCKEGLARIGGKCEGSKDGGNKKDDTKQTDKKNKVKEDEDGKDKRGSKDVGNKKDDTKQTDKKNKNKEDADGQDKRGPKDGGNKKDDTNQTDKKNKDKRGKDENDTTGKKDTDGKDKQGKDENVKTGKKDTDGKDKEGKKQGEKPSDQPSGDETPPAEDNNRQDNAEPSNNEGDKPTNNAKSPDKESEPPVSEPEPEPPVSEPEPEPPVSEPEAEPPVSEPEPEPPVSEPEPEPPVSEPEPEPPISEPEPEPPVSEPESLETTPTVPKPPVSAPSETKPTTPKRETESPADVSDSPSGKESTTEGVSESPVAAVEEPAPPADVSDSPRGKESNTEGVSKSPVAAVEEPAPCVDEKKKEKIELPLVTPPGPKIVNCLGKDDPHGSNYQGDISQTIGGLSCQKWTSNKPHNTNRYEGVFSEKDENNCRNRLDKNGSGLQKKPWCFTTDPNVNWQECNIPPCTNIDEEQGFDESPPAPAPLTDEEKGCFKASDNGESYDGKVNYIPNGEPCENWRDHGKEEDHNYCRNYDIDNHKMPYCFVNKRPVVCADIQECREEETKEEKDNPPACSVQTSVALCGTVTTLTGSCEQTFDHPGECRVKAVLLNPQKYKLVFSLEDFEVLLEMEKGEGKIQRYDHTKCGRFHLTDNNQLTWTSPTCGMCMKSSYSTIMPDPESYSLKPSNKLFCRAP